MAQLKRLVAGERAFSMLQHSVLHSDDAVMATSSTTSIRLPKELKRELERKARSTKRGKNWVIREALEHYLLGSSHDTLREDARKQSLAATKRTPADAAWAEKGGDTDGWHP